MMISGTFISCVNQESSAEGTQAVQPRVSQKSFVLKESLKASGHVDLPEDKVSNFMLLNYLLLLTVFIFHKFDVCGKTHTVNNHTFNLKSY